jgi:P27 family predicted phage terminase small subunit
MRGRKPKPTKLKLVNGNPGHRPLNRNEPEPEALTPDPPAHLSAIAVEEWNRITAELEKLKLISSIDRAALAAYCQCYARWVEAETYIEFHGLTITTTLGNSIANPAVGIANTAMKLMGKFLVEFGMTPSSRTRLSVSKGKDQSKWADDL